MGGRRSSLLLLLALGCAAQGRFRYPLHETSGEKAPPGWEKVQVVEASTKGDSPVDLAVPPAEALGRALVKRVGQDGERPLSLFLSSVRANEEVNGDALRLGLGVDVELRDEKGTSKKFSLEHSVTSFETDLPARNALYARLVDDLVDRILHHPQAVAALHSTPGKWRDRALASGAEVGPILPTGAQRGVQGTGRIHWGKGERMTSFIGNVMVGKTNGGFVSTSGRESTGILGYRWSLGVGGLAVQDSAAFLFTSGVGAELGLSTIIHSDEGYVERPGISLMLVPQLNIAQIMLPGSTFMQITSLTFGGSAEVDLPITSFLGLTGGVFAGGSMVAMTGGAFSSLMGPVFAWYPMGDLYIQTSSSRISLGVAFKALSDPEEFLKSPQIVFTYQSWSGRGIAYSSESTEAFDIGLNRKVDVLSSPRSAFYDPATGNSTWSAVSGSQPSKIAFAPAAPVPVVAAAAPVPAAPAVNATAPAPAPSVVRPKTRWVLLRPELKGFDPGEDAVIEMIAQQALADGGVDVVPADQLRAALKTLGLERVEGVSMQDVAGALGAHELLRVRLSRDGTEVRYELEAADVTARALSSLAGTVTRTSFLRVLREKTKELIMNGGQRRDWPETPPVAAADSTKRPAAGGH